LLVNFYANILENTVNDLIKFVTLMNSDQTKKGDPIDEIIIQISSSGGSSDHGLLAYNFFKQTGLSITTIGMGNVDSAAVMLYCAGDNRISVPSCRFLLHEATATITGQFNHSKLKELTEVTERINNDYCNVIANVCGKNLSSVKKNIKDGLVMSSDKAKKFGLVKTITEEPYLKDRKNVLIIGINNPQIIQPPPQKAEI
jgi:ATP-dependent protease ClpP protease subunit